MKDGYQFLSTKQEVKDQNNGVEGKAIVNKQDSDTVVLVICMFQDECKAREMAPAMDLVQKQALQWIQAAWEVRNGVCHGQPLRALNDDGYQSHGMVVIKARYLVFPWHQNVRGLLKTVGKHNRHRER